MKRTLGLAAAFIIAGSIFAASEAQAKLEAPAGTQSAPIQINDANLTLTFSANVDLNATQVVIQDAAKAPVATEGLRLSNDGTNIKVPLAHPLRPGALYTVSWHAQATDGRVSEGTYTFKVAPSDTISVQSATPAVNTASNVEPR